MKITIGNNISLTDVHPQIKAFFIQNLTFNNPLYEDAVKHGRYVGRIRPTLNMYTSTPHGITIPRGMLQVVEDSLISKGLVNEIVDERVLLEPLDFQSKIVLRDYQETAKRDILRHPNGILVAPAGSGKTIMGLDLFATLRQRTIWITHTKRLLNQAVDRIVAMTDIPKKEIGLIGNGKWSVGDKITVALVQTLVRNPDKLLELGREFGLVIVDECLVSGSEILMLDGSIRDIKDVKDGEVTTFGSISNKFFRISNNIINLRGNWGEIKGTPTHNLPYLSKDNLKSVRKDKIQYAPVVDVDINMGTMENINVGDFLLIKEEFQHVVKHTVGKEKSRLLALIACDGHVEKHLSCLQIGVSKDVNWFIDELTNNTNFVEDSDIRISKCKRKDTIIRCYSKEAIAYVNQYVPAGKKSRIIKVPSIMFNASKEDIANYLQVVFDTEGAVTNQITLTMASHEFIHELVFLLRKFGIVGRLIPIKHKDMLRISMSGYDALRFYKCIGFSIRRKQKLLKKLLGNTRTFRRTVLYKGIKYRCVEVLEKQTVNEPTTVYDFTTDQHLFIANGVLSSNCHHIPSTTFTTVLGYFYSYYLYSLTATPYRRDKLESLMFAAIGNANARIHRDIVKDAGGTITPSVIVRNIPCPVVEHNDYHAIIEDFVLANEARSNIIAADVIREAKLGNYCIVICTRKSYCDLLYNLIYPAWNKTGVANGDQGDKHNREQVSRLENDEISVLITTFELLGEGFDVPKLNRGFIALPFRERVRVEQAVGRIQRTCEGKHDAVLYDYVDTNIGILNNQFRTRSFVYELLGMEVQ